MIALLLPHEFAAGKDLFAPRDVFFSNYVLFSAQEDVTSMALPERIAFGTLLKRCTNTLIAAEAVSSRCEMERAQYLINYRQGRNVDRLFDAVAFMSILLRYNESIGRESESGLRSRPPTIYGGLADALRISAGASSTEPLDR